MHTNVQHAPALLSPRQMPVINSDANVNADAESAAAFFSGICAPADTGALASGGKWDGVCSGCKVGLGWGTSVDIISSSAGVVLVGGTVLPAQHAQLLHSPCPADGRLLHCHPLCQHTPQPQPSLPQGDCSSNDTYWDYTGAVRCLMEGAGACVLHMSSPPFF